ncbi:MAG: tetratricopeptide repeat protein [Candidatus Thermochlorobacter sp.]
MRTSANSTTSHILLFSLLSSILLFGCASPHGSIKGIDTLNDEQAMFEAFGKFAQEHPDSPESVYALYRRGEILQKRGRFEDAKQEYARALERNAALSQKNERYALLALYRQSDLLYADYKRLQPAFVIPPSAFEPKQSAERITYAPATTEKLSLKKTLGKSLVDLLNGFRTQGASVGATVTDYINVADAVCYLSEEFGDGFMRLGDSVRTLRDAQGRALNPNKMILAAYQAYVDAAAQYDIAAKEYKTLREELLNARTDSATSPAVLSAIEPLIEKFATKIVEMRYKSGYAHEQNALLTLGAEPDEAQKNATLKLPIEQIDLPIGEIASLLYLSQIVERFVRPSLEQAVKFYTLGLKESTEMNVATTNYAAMSEQAILELGQKAAQRSDSLSHLALRYFDEAHAAYLQKLSLLGIQTPKDTLELFVQAKRMERLLKTHHDLVLNALAEYDKAFKVLKEIGISESAISPVRERAYMFSDTVLNAVKMRQARLTQFLADAQKTAKKDRRKVWYLSALAHYEPLVAMLRSNFSDFQESRSRLAVMK